MANGRLSKELRLDYERRSGLDILRQYIPDNDYNDALIEHVSKNLPPVAEGADRSDIRERMIDKASAILAYLRNNGYDFSISTDRSDGQLKAKLTDTNMEIRLLDKDENSNYVGRAYAGGINYRFSKENAYRDDAAKRGSNMEADITPDMAVDLVKYALGESVNRLSQLASDKPVLDDYVGEFDDISNVKSLKTYTTQDSFVSLYEKRNMELKPTGNGTHTAMSSNINISAQKTAAIRRPLMFLGETALSDAEEFVEASRSNAVMNFKALFKAEAVNKLAEMKANKEFEVMPEFSDNKTVADLQKEYYLNRLAVYKDAEKYPDEASRSDILAQQDIELQDKIDALFGNVSLRTINPVNVAAYMDQSVGYINNEADLCAALKAIQKHGTAYNIEGEGFAENGFKEKLIAYDDKPVYDNDGNKIYPRSIDPKNDNYKQLSPFWQKMGETVNQSLNETGIAVTSIDVDQNGIVHYEGIKHKSGIRGSKSGKSVNKEDAVDRVYGNIGQIFEPDSKEFNDDGTPNLKYGLIETKFNSDDNYYIAPGYTAYIVPPVDANDTRSYEERTRLRGYVQQLTSEIKYELRSGIISGNNYDNTTGLNSVYHHLYGDKLSLDFEAEMMQEGKDALMIKAINDTSMRRVRYDSCYKDGTSILAKMNAEKREFTPNRGYNMYLDNVRANMAIMDPNTSSGIFDPTNTGTGTNQGIVRYLTSDAVVNNDGSITRGKNNLCPLTEHEDFKYLSFNPPDRGIMSLMNAMNQSSTARGRSVNPAGEPIEPIGVGTAHMSLGGYTQDDAFVVSQDFANANAIRGEDGIMRPLQVGDKICDHSGNKGVISFVADRNADMRYFEPMPVTSDMSEREARNVRAYNATRAAQKRVRKVFQDNPTLDVVGAPYTAPSRFNGGTAREMIASQEAAHKAGMATDLNVEGKTFPGSIGYVNWIITDMPVDEKTHIYASDGDGGRKASGQLVWGLAELGAKELIDEIYKFNNEPTIKTREMLIATGLDLSETGEIRVGYKPHMIGTDDNGEPVYEQRKEFSTRQIAAENRDPKGEIHRGNYDAKFNELMAEDGGFMLIPFPLNLAGGIKTPEKLDDNGKGTGEYMLPILAGKYRSNRETVDNKLMLHEYTANYKQIFIASRQYIAAKEACDKIAANGQTVDDKMLAKLSDTTDAAQRAYNTVSNDIIDRHFTGKHNIFKDEVMRKQLQGTATAVISPDPSLDLDEVSMTATTAISIGIDVDNPDRSDTPVMMWRDPLLSGGGIRKFRPRIIENRLGYPGYDIRNPALIQVGVSINPSSATSFEGDFDGDSMGIYVPQTKAGIKCVNEKLSFASQLLNKEVGERGHHSAYFQDGLDVASGLYYDAENGGDVKARMDEAVAIANEVNLHGENYKTGVCSKAAFNKFNKAMHDAQDAAFGHDVICYASPEKHIESLIPMVKSGAKGSPKKLVEGYGPYFGAKFEIDDNYELKNFEDVGKPYVTVEQRQASFAATHAKAYLTGVAGKFSQHAQMMALNASKSDDVFSYSAAATALTHPVTQSVMQLKHDGTKEILHKINMIQTVAPALWSGMKIQPNAGAWEVVTDNNGNGVQATPDEWKKMFKAFYEDKQGLNVGTPNPEYVSQMADIMTVDTPDGKKVFGFDTKTKAIMKSEKPLTRLAYECTFDTVCEYARSSKRESIFAGNVSNVIAPKVVRENLIEQNKASITDGYVPQYQALRAKDTQFRDKAPIPAVDVIDKFIREQNTESVTNGVSEKVTKSAYEDMTVAERTDVVKSLVEKAAAKIYKGQTPELTDTEKEVCSLYKQQTDSIKSMGSDGAAAYEAKNPDAFREYRMYSSMMREEKKKYLKPLDLLSQADYETVAATVVEAYMTSNRGVAPQFNDVNLNEFNSRLKLQGQKLDGIDKKDRSAYINTHKSEFRERLTCANIRAKLEAERKTNAARVKLNELAADNKSVSAECDHDGLGG